MNLGEAKSHVKHAVGGDPSVAPGQTSAERTIQVINHAGEQLYTRPWKFRNASVLLDLTEDQETLTQPDGMLFSSGGELVSAVRTADGLSIETVTAEQMDHLRDGTMSSAAVNGYTSHIAIIWSGGSQKIHVYPTPSGSVADAVRFRYRKAWKAVTSSDDDGYNFPIPKYVEPLFTAYLRLFAIGYEDDGMTMRLAEVDTGPILQTSLMKDGIASRDVGRLRPQRGRTFRVGRL